MWILLALFSALSLSAIQTILDTATFSSTLKSLSSTDSLLVRGNHAAVMTFDGRSNTLFFPDNDLPVITIVPNATLIMQNITLVGFRPSHVVLQSPTSRFLFGNRVFWELESDLDFSKTMTAVGNLMIQGNNNVVTFADNASLQLSNQVYCEFRNCKLKGIGDFVDLRGRNATSIMCAADAHLRLNNVTGFLDTSWSFTSGFLDVFGDSEFRGVQKRFTYSSISNFTINPYSSLTFKRGMTFQYASRAGRNKMILPHASSQLFFEGATFLCGVSGLTLTTGQLFLKGDVTLSTVSLDQTKGFVLDDSLLTVILNNSSLLVDGVVAHGQPA